jgi:YVTN family beta-propeller protein
LLQTDPFNHPGNDAEFYVGSASASPAANGIGAEGQYDGALAPDTWYRVAFAVDLTASAGQQLSKYVNGVLVGSQSLSGGVDGRYALGPAAQLFTTGLSGGFTQPGYVSSIQVVNGWMPAADIAALGGPSAAKLPPGDAVIQITNLSLNASQLTLNWGGPGGQFQVRNSPTLGQPVWQSIGTLSTNRSLTIPANGAMGFYRVTQPQPDIQIGQLPYGEQCISSKEILRSAGSQLQFYGLPVDLALSPDGKTVYIKNTSNLLVVDAASWTLLQTLSYPASGASLHGIAVNKDGTHVYVTGSGNELYDWTIANGTVSFSRTISLASGSDPCGLALSGDGTKAYVCLSIANKLAVVNLTSGTVSQQIAVGIAPWNVVLSPDGNTAYISDWGGRFPKAGDLTETSAGTAVVIDSRGVAASGVLSVVNLTSGLETAEVVTGLHPSDLVLSRDGSTLYVANANSDTVTVINTQAKTVRETILVRPSSTLPFGSSSTLPFGSETDGLALSADGTNLFVACAGNNAIALVELPNAQHTNSVVQGFFPTDWYPGAVAADSNYVYVANVKGLGTRYGQPAAISYAATSSYLGTANRIPVPSAEALSKYSAQVNKNGRLSQIQQAQQAPLAGQLPVPVPVHAGERSVFQHVLYIIKENKTYDEVFGDMAQGNGNPSLCIYPQFNTPNHHALAQQYVLLDNFYDNGVNSAVGHSWCTEANDSDHLEKSFGGWARSYGINSDPLTYVSSGFIWNNVLQHGLSFRNYGELMDASVPSGATWGDMYADYTNGTHSIAFANSTGIASLVPYTSPNVPGWDLNIPDQVRAYGFIKDLNAAQANGSWTTFNTLWLPDDHTGGTPPAQAQVADNDLALGQIVEAVTKSAFGSNTVIFVIEDDPQSGYDHVDGHRSLCLVISPYTKRNQVVSTFFNQTGLLHTMEQIMGLPPMNQGDAMAPLMFDCFTNTPNFTPYTALPSNINLVSGGTAMLSTKARYYAKKVQKMDFSKPDRINDDIFNRYIWHSIKGDARYPSEFVGGHGKGLKKLGLVLTKANKEDDD